MPQSTQPNQMQLDTLKTDIQSWAHELGFQQMGVTSIHLSKAEQHLNTWLTSGFHGDMAYMANQDARRAHPQKLLPGTVRILSLRMNYLPDPQEDLRALVENPALAYISRYALGRDYHKLMRHRLKQLAQRIEAACGKFSYRICVDSAPVLEKPLAQQAGLGWIGKHTNLINQHTGSWFFLGEIYLDLPLPVDASTKEHCGTCQACIDICPTRAIVAPFVLDARLCISYLTIELKGAIPQHLRPAIGNRIFGCDDCQIICPWNSFAKRTDEADFLPRHGLDQASLLELFAWSEAEFLSYTEGSAIRRLGFERWRRNLAVALGNGEATGPVIMALKHAWSHAGPLELEHIEWALTRLGYTDDSNSG